MTEPTEQGLHELAEKATPESCICPDSFHDTPTPVSDDAVREALDDYERHIGNAYGVVSDEWQQFRRFRATLEAAIHQRDERIGELEAEKQAAE